MSPTLTKFQKLNPTEIMFENYNREFKIFIICYWLTLEFKNKVSEEQIKEALRIISRNMEILNLCIRKENGHYWFYKMDEEKIPLQVLKNQSPESVYWKRGEYMYRFCNWTTLACYLYYHFSKALNDVIGKNVQKIYDFGQFNDGHETKELLIQRTEYLKSNHGYCEEIRTMKSKFDNAKVLLTEYFPVQKDAEKKTKFIHGEINKEITANLIKVFKSKGISFHAGFCSVFNWVLMDTLTEKGLTDKEIELPTRHALNLRRYWKKSSSEQLGYHVKSFALLSKTDQNVGENFWEYAKEFNKELKSAIENMRAIDWTAEEYLANMSSEPQLDDSLKVFENVPPPPITPPSLLPPSHKVYYNTSNIGDISSNLQGERDHVNIKFLSRGASIR
ncbi:hypothetical protein Avbf_14478, partial [Armadillidium vulgare]